MSGQVMARRAGPHGRLPRTASSAHYAAYLAGKEARYRRRLEDAAAGLYTVEEIDRDAALGLISWRHATELLAVANAFTTTR